MQNSSQKQYISLQFSRLATECSYDYLYVYDGDSYHGRLLGSFSGRVRFEYLKVPFISHSLMPYYGIAVNLL